MNLVDLTQVAVVDRLEAKVGVFHQEFVGLLRSHRVYRPRGRRWRRGREHMELSGGSVKPPPKDKPTQEAVERNQAMLDLELLVEERFQLFLFVLVHFSFFLGMEERVTYASII